MLGDVRPKNILINSNGLIKVPTLNSWPLELNKYQKALGNIPTYLSPQQMKFLQAGTVESYHLTEPAEMFSIGLTLLGVLNLQDYDFIYNFDTLKFDFLLFDEGVSELILDGYYSQVLRGAIMNLCSVQPKRRMTYFEISGILSKH